MDSLCFRPLSGSYISQYEKCLIDGKDENGFRPLSGSYISQWELHLSLKFSHHVSVPYRGATFLNLGVIIYEEKRTVSVPYRGATFLNLKYIWRPQIGKSFRPLSGSYISQFYYAKRTGRTGKGFRPLSGSYISQLNII